MPLRTPDPGTFEKLLSEVRIPASSLVRLSKYPATEPHWSKGRYRFDGPDGPGGFGTTYAADSLGVAFCESVIHECSWFSGGKYNVPMADLTARHIIELARPSKPELVLANLTGRALKKLGLNNDISASDDYAIPMAWARAIHDCNAKWDGILYVSRQHNDCKAVALFERSAVVVARRTKLRGKTLDDLCDEYQVVAV